MVRTQEFRFTSQAHWMLGGAGLALLLICAWFFLTTSVPAGHVGIVDTFGNVEQAYRPAGLQLKLPYQSIAPMSVKTTEMTETADTPSQEGLTVSLDVSVLYRLEENRAVEIYKTIGKNYESIYILPTFRSVVRGITASYDAKSLYTSQREVIAQRIFDDLAPRLKERGIILERVLLRSITLPDQVKLSIETKLVAEQEAEKMQFVLQKETQEAERKIIEAGGIAEAQAIIDKSLTDEYLTWYWISNLDKYRSVIYVPIGSSGMPLFKDIDNTEEWGTVAEAFNGEVS